MKSNRRRRPPESSGTRTLRHAGRAIEFELVRSDRRTVGLTVRPDGSVVARAPRRAREADVVEWVAGHADWVLRRQDDDAERARRAPPRRFVDGETHLYLGRQYRLRIERVGPGGRGPAGTEAERVRLRDGELCVTVRGDASPGRVAELVDAWYMRRARLDLAARLDACWDSFPHDGLARPTLRVRRMRSRWGSLSPAGAMSLRLDLVRAPVECIDYVIFHELCHLAHRGHGPAFWAAVGAFVPDWKERRRRLELLPA